MKYVIGIDNGVTGGIAVLTLDTREVVLHINTPIKSVLDYQKKSHFISRVDYAKLVDLLLPYKDSIAYLERPMVNPTRFKATASALRCLEATLIVLEAIGIPYKFVDSKAWQSALLPKGLKKEQLKKASLEVVRQRFGIEAPNSGISDSILIAEFGRQSELLNLNKEEKQ